MNEAWAAFLKRGHDLDALGAALGLLEWDQQTGMPKKGGTSRGKQAGVLSRIHHELATGADLGGWLERLSSGLEQGEQVEGTDREIIQAAIFNATRRYHRSTRVPSSLIEQLAEARAAGFAGWMQARENNDFKLFEAPLQRLIELHRQLAEKLDPGAHPYDALLEEYDPGSKIESLKPMFARLGAGLNEFLNALATSTVTPYTFNETLEVPDQTRLMQRVARDMGFDFEAGRLDVSEHPFTLGMDATDVRITIKPNRSNLLGMLGSLIHEGGHGLYEQGLPMELAGTGLNRAAGMGLHESQSRLWENFIGRSHAFAQYLLPRMQGIWPTLELTVDQLFGALNRVERSLIRVMADEVTYNLHIIVRFELEVAILEGKLQAKDLPDAWDMGYKQQVGIVASIAKEGVLQDIHWSSGLFGYFPSYTIGNLYAASIGATLQEQNPGLWEEVAKGDFRWILGWLRQHIHQRGHRKDAPLLFAEAVGDRDPVADLLNYVWKRHGAIYGVQRT